MDEVRLIQDFLLGCMGMANSGCKELKGSDLQFKVLFDYPPQQQRWRGIQKRVRSVRAGISMTMYFLFYLNHILTFFQSFYGLDLMSPVKQVFKPPSVGCKHWNKPATRFELKGWIHQFEGSLDNYFNVLKVEAFVAARFAHRSANVCSFCISLQAQKSVFCVTIQEM